MCLAREIGKKPGVSEVAALMGTPANLEILLQAGLTADDEIDAGPNDLILAVEADSQALAHMAIEEARAFLTQAGEIRNGGSDFLPSSLEGAIAAVPGANLAMISIPGDYAAKETMRAIRNGLHVFLFSDNVPVDDEVTLKQEAIERGLLLMGPDCGTAYIGGVGLGFANVVKPGRVGCIAASGTGLQAVASQLDALGEGISHGIGVGGRDLSAKVGGLMTLHALDFLSKDACTEIVVLISKPPGAEVLPRIEEALETFGKPHVVCFLGTENPGWAETLEDAGNAVAAMLRGETCRPENFFTQAEVKEKINALNPKGEPARGGILGLFSGGTLAHESHLILKRLLGEVSWNGDAGRHRILDLGDDRYTVGKPHPMIDPEPRSEMIAQCAGDDGVSIVLFDLILGRASAQEPAGPLAEVIRKANGQERGPLFVASVVGTAEDPQGFEEQVKILQGAGVTVLPSNAQATRFAAALAKPELLGVE